MEFLAYFLVLAGFVFGLGAVTVIDLHGFLGRKSAYWTEATIRAHKITKPLIWLGIILVLMGSIFLKNLGALSSGDFYIRVFLIAVLILNGCFLSFVISPTLLKREREGRAGEILPQKMRNKITASFLFSFLGWWSLVFLFVKTIL